MAELPCSLDGLANVNAKKTPVASNTEVITSIKKSTSSKGANDSCGKKLANKNVWKSNNTHVTSSEKDGDDSSSREARSKEHKSEKQRHY